VKIETKGIPGYEVAKKMLWLAWRACGGPVGMGALQDRPNATEEDVWNSMECAGDYGGFSGKQPGLREVRADYVFGRMMKLYFTYGEAMDAENAWVDVPDETPRPDYQSWFARFSTYETLVHAAIAACQESTHA